MGNPWAYLDEGHVFKGHDVRNSDIFLFITFKIPHKNSAWSSKKSPK